MDRTSRFTEAILSNQLELLRTMIGQKVTALIRCSWDPYRDFDPYRLYDIQRSDFFRLTSGALIMRLENGVEIGFSSQDSLASLTTWMEKDGINGKSEDYYGNDHELFLIHNTHPEYTTLKEQLLSNQVISGLQIVYRKPQTVLYEALPNEAGLLFQFESGANLLLSHGLFKSPDNFSIGYFEVVDETILTELVFKSLF